MTYLDQLNTACSLTEEMLNRAKEENWEQVIALESQRQVCLLNMDKCLPEKPDASIDEKLQELVALNNELTKVSTIAKNNCYHLFSQNKNTKKAFHTYSGA